MRVQRIGISLALLIDCLLAFTVLPYVQIDFGHYFRLAQCATKCTDAYGVATRRRLLDGTYHRLYNTSNDAHKYCELGCSHHDSMRRKGARSLREPLSNGVKFWEQSSSRSGASAGSTSPVSSVDVGCMNLSPIDSSDYEESVEALVFIRLRQEPNTPLRFIVQWKQRTYAFGSFEESHWITASVESERVFKVDGMVSGVQYRFLVTAIGPGGRLGNPVLSGWVDALALGQSMRPPAGPLMSSVRFNSEDGMSALISWNGTNRAGIGAALRPPESASSFQFDSCFYRIVWTNETHQQTHAFTLDGGDGFLLRHLAFNHNYTVTLNALTSVAVGEHPVASPPITVTVKTLACTDVFGRGSLSCPPEPVTNLTVSTSMNGSAFVQWIPSANESSVLIYQLYYEAIPEDPLCMVEPKLINLPAATTSYKLRLPTWQRCEYLFRLSNFDLLARDAFVETTVIFDPIAARPGSIAAGGLWLLAAVLVIVVPLCTIVLRLLLARNCGKKVLKRTNQVIDHV